MAEFLPTFEFIPENVKEIIIQYGNEALFYKNLPIEHRVYNLLKLLNISPSLKGYTYIKYILETYSTNESQYPIPSLSNYVFPKISEIYYTTPSRVERNIRNVIDKFKEDCEPPIFNYFFGKYKKITCSIFLSQLVEFLKLINY